MRQTLHLKKDYRKKKIRRNVSISQGDTITEFDFKH